MLPSWCSQSITVVKPGTTTERGSTVPDWDNPKSLTTVTGCSVQPQTTSLSQDGRVLGTSEGWKAYIPEGTAVEEGDHIIFEGETYEIDGIPQPWTGPILTSHIQLNLKRWEG